VKKYPDKFVAMCSGTAYNRKVRRGEIEWSIEGICRHLDDLLSTGLYRCGIGESIPRNMARKKPYSWEGRFEEICQVMEIARKHKVPVGYHSGTLSGYGGAFRGIWSCFW